MGLDTPPERDNRKDRRKGIQQMLIRLASDKHELEKLVTLIACELEYLPSTVPYRESFDKSRGVALPSHRLIPLWSLVRSR
jgi:hypothetical protein